MVMSFACSIYLAVGNVKSLFDTIYAPIEILDVSKRIKELKPNDTIRIQPNSNLFLLKCEEGGNLQLIITDIYDKTITLDNVSFFVIDTKSIKYIDIINPTVNRCTIATNF